MTGAHDPEFSRTFALEDLRRGGRVVDIVADAEERAALAARFGIEALTRLTAQVRLDPADQGAVLVTGSFEADVTQTCVVSLEPVAQRIRERFTMLFAPAPDAPDGREITVSPLDDDPPEPLRGEAIDVGELVAEHLALALDPYPRHPDAPDGPIHLESGDPIPASPFAVLGQLKSKM